MRAWAAAAAIGALLCGPAGVAAATPGQDQVFYQILTANGMTPTIYSVTVAHAICADVWAGASPWTEVSKIWRTNRVATWDDATIFVAAAIKVYCPATGDDEERSTPTPRPQTPSEGTQV